MSTHFEHVVQSFLDICLLMLVLRVDMAGNKVVYQVWMMIYNG